VLQQEFGAFDPHFEALSQILSSVGFSVRGSIAQLLSLVFHSFLLLHNSNQSQIVEEEDGESQVKPKQHQSKAKAK